MVDLKMNYYWENIAPIFNWSNFPLYYAYETKWNININKYRYFYVSTSLYNQPFPNCTKDLKTNSTYFNNIFGPVFIVVFVIETYIIYNNYYIIEIYNFSYLRNSSDTFVNIFLTSSYLIPIKIWRFKSNRKMQRKKTCRYFFMKELNIIYYSEFKMKMNIGKFKCLFMWKSLCVYTRFINNSNHFINIVLTWRQNCQSLIYTSVKSRVIQTRN